MSIPVSVPIFSYLHYSPSKNLGCINDLRRAVVQDIRLNYQNITLSQVSLRTLVSSLQNFVFGLIIKLVIYCPQGVPVPLEPHDTLHKRVLDSARDDGYTTVRVQDAVCHHWSDTDKIHVYVDINRGPGEPDSRTHPTCNAQLPHCQWCKLLRICTKKYGEKISRRY